MAAREVGKLTVSRGAPRMAMSYLASGVSSLLKQSTFGTPAKVFSPIYLASEMSIGLLSSWVQKRNRSVTISCW